MNNNITRLDIKSTQQIFYADQTDVFKICMHNYTPSSDERYSSFEDYGRVNFMINFDAFHKYSAIKSIKIRLKSLIDSATYYELSMEQSLDTNIRNIQGVFSCVNKNFESDVTQLCYESMTGKAYFSFVFRGSATIYNNVFINGANKPCLIVEYIDDKDNLSEQKKLEGSTGPALDYQINLLNGKPSFVKHLLTNTTLAIPLNLRMYFDPLYSEDNDETNRSLGMPNGWKFNYNQRVIPNNEGYIYIDGYGNRHQFGYAQNSFQVFCDIAGTGLIMEVEDGICTINDGYNNQLEFNTLGLLKRITLKLNQNVYGLEMEYNANNDIIKIKEYVQMQDSSITITDKVIIAYTDRAITITASDYPSITLNINNKVLTSVVEEDNRISSYAYNSDNLLETAASDNGEKTTFLYDSRFRVKEVKNYVNEEINLLSKKSIAYRHLGTYVTNNFGIKKSFSFDEEGNYIGEAEIIDNEYKNIKKLKKQDNKRTIDVSNIEVLDGYPNTTIANNSVIVEQTVNRQASLSRGTLTYGSQKKYNISFVYRFIRQKDSTLSYEEGQTPKTYVSIIQDGVELKKIPIDKYVLYDKIISDDFLSLSSSNVIVKIGHCLIDGILEIRSLTIHEIENVSTDFYWNFNNLSTESHNLDGITFYNYECSSFTYSSSDLTVRKQMFKADLIENVKNYHLNHNNHHIWFCNKRKMLANTSNMLFVGSECTKGLGDVIFCEITIHKDNKFYNFFDYENSENTPNYFRTEYSKVQKDGSDSSVLLSKKIIDRNYQIMKEISLENKLITSYEYDDYGNVVLERQTNNNSSLKFENRSTYNKGVLLNETRYNGQIITGTRYNSNMNNGRLMNVRTPNGLSLTYTYENNTLDKLKKIYATVDNKLNANEITYQKDKVINYKGINKGLSFQYDAYNMENQFKDGSLEIYNITRIFSSNGIDEIIEYPVINYWIKKHYDQYGNLSEVYESSNGTAYVLLLKNIHRNLAADNSTEINDIEKNSYSKLRITQDHLLNNAKAYKYDIKGNIVAETNTQINHKPSGKVYNYDEENRLYQINLGLNSRAIQEKTNYVSEFDNTISSYNTIVNGSGYAVNSSLIFRKDGLNRIIGKKYQTFNGNSLIQMLDYLDNEPYASNLVSKVDYYVNNANNKVRTLNYSYDNMERIVQINNADNSVLNKYTYDRLGRLVREDNQKFNRTTVIEYDENGNILNKKIAPFTLNAFTPIETIAYTYSSDLSDVLTSYNGKPVTTTRNGNISSIGNVTYTWERAKNLAKVAKSSTDYVEFKYDAFGMRYKKTVVKNGETRTHLYLTDENRILTETIVTSGAAQLLEYFYLGNELAGFVINGNKYFFQKNIQNDIIAIYGSNNELVATYEYDAWGNHKVYDVNGNENTSESFIGNINPFRYRGYYYDNQTGLFYCNYRYYSPELCRWISPDSIDYLDPESINGLNLYAYCGNDPINRCDPTGHDWKWSSFWQGVGYLVTGVGAIVAGALVIASGVATWPMLLVAGITIGAGALTTINGTSEVIEAGTGYNFVEDTIFGGNSSAYNTYATITGTVATVGSIVCGAWYKYNTPRIQAYKNVGNYDFSGTLSDSTHLARPYQHSTLLQRNIIKYGKMVKESSGIYNFTIGGAYKVGWVSYGIGNVGSNPVTWKLVLDIGKQIIFHAGF